MPQESLGPCIAACYACATVCERCTVACLDEDHDPDMSHVITLTMDAAQMCNTAAALLSRQSDFVDTVCEACAEVCRACAAACFRHNVRVCRQCADACTRCESLCREVVRNRQSSAAYA